MPADILILKKRGEKYHVKITEQMKNRYVPARCDIIVNMKDYKDLAQFLEDLRLLWSCPVEKAIEEYKRKQREGSGIW